MHGTVAPVLAARLQEAGVEVVGWNRQEVPIEDASRGDEFTDRVKPDLIVHLAMGSPDWAGYLAAAAAKRIIPFVYISSVSVFDGSRSGPFSPEKEPDANDDYGRYKSACERRVREHNPQAHIARIGWQIGNRPGSNNMVDFFHRQQTERGKISASARWYPSCSFLEDTADGLWRMLQTCPPGIYHLEGNDGHSFLEIARGLNRNLRAGWTIEESSEPTTDIRMRDERIQLQPIGRRLKEVT